MENKTEESIIVTIDDTEGNSRDFVQDMVIPFDGKEFAGYRTKRVGKNLYYACIKGRIRGILKYARVAL